MIDVVLKHSVQDFMASYSPIEIIQLILQDPLFQYKQCDLSRIHFCLSLVNPFSNRFNSTQSRGSNFESLIRHSWLNK